jgi:dTDP-4-dehydrorhamnose reductase
VNLVVVGAKGMLGTDLAEVCRAAGHQVAALDLPEIDITAPASVEHALPPAEWVINCAAYTLVDQAESDRETAFRTNGEGAANLARVCHTRGMRVLQISTDYVFSGCGSQPYREDDPTEPVNAYGASKLAGEEAVLAEGDQHLVVRVESLFGVHGRNFVRTIAGRLQEGAELRVVNDQVCSPSYTRHIAEGLLRLLPLSRAGIVHLTASGSCTWYELAVAIADRVRPGAVIQPVSSAEYPTPARRPACSVLDNSRYRAWTGYRMPSWQEGLAAYLSEERA